jgi:hypothetical protein
MIAMEPIGVVRSGRADRGGEIWSKIKSGIWSKIKSGIWSKIKSGIWSKIKRRRDGGDDRGF